MTELARKYRNIICAIDTTNVRAAVALTSYIRNKVAAVKLGLEFFNANGPQGVREIQKYQVPIFLDLKMHDIPNTVEKAMRAVVNLGAYMVTVHTLGGEKMLKAAVNGAHDEAAKTGRSRPMVLGVTILTSMDKNDMKQIGINKAVESQVVNLAKLAKLSDLDGIVCSSHELEIVKRKIGNELKLIVPGIRPKDASTDDQKRVMMPREAVEKGADYIVVGRPITTSNNPVQVIEEIADDVDKFYSPLLDVF